MGMKVKQMNRFRLVMVSNGRNNLHSKRKGRDLKKERGRERIQRERKREDPT